MYPKYRSEGPPPLVSSVVYNLEGLFFSFVKIKRRKKGREGRNKNYKSS